MQGLLRLACFAVGFFSPGYGRLNSQFQSINVCARRLRVPRGTIDFIRVRRVVVVGLL